MTTKWIMSAACLAVLATTLATPVRAQDDDVIRQTVARIAFVEGDASYSRGDDPDNWQAAAINVPMTLGDRLYTGDGSRLELQLHGAWIRMAPGSDLTALNLTHDVKQFSLTGGTASFRIRSLQGQEVFEVDTPNAAVTFETAGDYRIDVDQDGNSRVTVRRGQSTVAAEGGQIPLSSGNAVSIQGFDNPSYDIVEVPGPDAWDRWVGFRDSQSSHIRSAVYVNSDIVGTEDLDRYGRWSEIPNYGQSWSPSTVSADWTPYRDGQWVWQDPWGWTWVGAEPWGWAPYHYGRWVTYSNRWYWVPVGRTAAVTYSPALVAFVGSGPGWSASVAVGGGGYVGWFPLAPSDPFVPWWGARRAADVNVNVTNVTYVNKTYVTVVNQNTFVSGARIANNYVRDPQVVRQVVSAPAVRGTVPIMPTVSSLRVTTAAARPAPRPPAAVVNRAVVTRVAPAAAPAPFQAKMRVIQENHGAPVAPSVGARISEEAHGGMRAAVPIRPAAVPSGEGRLTARRGTASSVQPQTVTAPHGKALATAQRPVVSTPAAASSSNAAPVRVAPGAVVAPPASRGGPPPQRMNGASPAMAPPPSAQAPPPPAPKTEAWREHVPPGQEKRTPDAQQAAPAREMPPERRVAPPPPAPPPPRPESAVPQPPPSRGRALPSPIESPPETAPPPPAKKQVAPPPEREAPPPQRGTPPETRQGPPSASEKAQPSGAPPAPRAKPVEKSEKQKEIDKQKEKDKKDKEKEPPPPPPSN
jgi:hypothetical protein